MLNRARYCGIEWNSSVDGEGFRTVIFFSGCRHRCPGCHNPETHDFSNGQIFDAKIQNEISSYVRETNLIAGVTLSGGDPMYSAEAVIPFVEELKQTCPSKSVWIYSGFTYEEIIQDPLMKRLLSLCDVLVDGPFIEALRDITLAFRGSSNQRIIDVQESLRTGNVVLYEDEF